MKWVYIFISDLTRNEYDYYFSLMDVNKQKQVSRYKNEMDKKRTIAGEMLARRMISKYCKVVPEDIYFETGCYGKPNAKHLNVEFNISHSEEVVVCAISDKPVGIDVETKNRNAYAVMKSFLQPREIEYVMACDIPADEALLLWSAKEAAFKLASDKVTVLKDICMVPQSGGYKVISPDGATAVCNVHVLGKFVLSIAVF